MLIDHILVSMNLSGMGKLFTIDLVPISDHGGLVGVFE